MKRLAIAGCKHTTKDLIEGLISQGFTIDLVITISKDKAAEQEVAGYLDLCPYLQEMNIPFYIAEKYSLKSAEDEAVIRKAGVDILLCMGWQRLIPEWFLNYLSVGAFGMHGSNKPLPHGRGRSPLNWSLIQDKQLFFTHLFKYNPGVDDGDIVGMQLFDITPFDDAHTLHLKNLLSMLKLCKQVLPGLLNGIVELTPQQDFEPSFYPKRSKEDGHIFWGMSTKDIYNLVRSVTKPFPGAFTYLEDSIVIIWKGIPFDSHIRWDDKQSGEICHVFYDNSFIVKTGDTSFYVREFEIIGQEKQVTNSMRFHDNDKKQKVWTNLPQ